MYVKDFLKKSLRYLGRTVKCSVSDGFFQFILVNVNVKFPDNQTS